MIDPALMTLAALLLRRAEISPRRAAVTFDSKQTTYGELADGVLRVAAGLVEHGVRAGDRVGYVGGNDIAFLEVLFAASCLGASFVPMNFRLTATELQFIVNDAGIHTLFADGDCAGRLEGVRENLCCKRFIAVDQAQSAWEPYSTVKQAAPIAPGAHGSNSGDIAIIMYTSGTTGRPKGAQLTNENLFWNFLNTLMAGEPLVGMVTLTCAPMFHVGGLNVTTLPTLLTGGHLILHRAFDADRILTDVENYRVESLWGAPAMFSLMAESPLFTSADLTSVDQFVCGGAPVPPALIRRYREKGVRLCQGYGLTETTAFVSLLGSAEIESRPDSAGKPPVFGEVRIVGPDGGLMAQGDRGEVEVRGPMVFKGYWNRPDATSEVLRPDGWLRTGDIGYLDECGFLFLCDRAKDIVISGGENVYPAEVEAAIYEHPAVLEVAVIGTPHEKWGEAVTAVVSVRAGHTLLLDDLREFLEGKVARYKMPLLLHVVDSLPRNSAGQVLKYVLRGMYG